MGNNYYDAYFTLLIRGFTSFISIILITIYTSLTIPTPRHLNRRHRPINIRLNLLGFTLKKQLFSFIEIVNGGLELLSLDESDSPG